MAKVPRRVAVIGVGVLGASVGWNLARRGVGVVLIDAGAPGAGVTDWTFSWVNASNKTARKSYFDLNVAGIVAHRRLTDAIGADSWWYPGGHLRWTDDAAEEAKFLEIAGVLAGWGYRVEMYTGVEVRRRFEPDLTTVPGDGTVLFYPDEAWVHGRRLVGRLVQHAVAAGAECRFGAAVREIGTRPDGSVRSVVLAEGGSLDVDAVVNAAGPDAAHVAAYVGRQLPMRWEPGVVTRIDCARVPIQRVMHAPHLELRPDGETSMVLHSREIDALIDTGVQPPELGRLLRESARRVLPELELGPEADLEAKSEPELERGSGPGNVSSAAQTRVSNRPIPADGFPSVGSVSTVPGYYEAVSHSGITLGPVLGQLLAAEITSGECDDMLADFRPERFAA